MSKIQDIMKNYLTRDVSRIIVIILIGILLLVIVMPYKSSSGKSINDSINYYGSQNAGNSNSVPNGIGYGANTYDANTYGANTYDANTNDEVTYYETKLKSILEKTYGEGKIDVMIHMCYQENTFSYSGILYDSGSGEGGKGTIDGVLVVAKVNNQQAVLDISNAVGALFNLPACKVAVLMR